MEYNTNKDFLLKIFRNSTKYCILRFKIAFFLVRLFRNVGYRFTGSTPVSLTHLTPPPLHLPLSPSFSPPLLHSQYLTQFSTQSIPSLSSVPSLHLSPFSSPSPFPLSLSLSLSLLPLSPTSSLYNVPVFKHSMNISFNQ